MIGAFSEEIQGRFYAPLHEFLNLFYSLAVIGSQKVNNDKDPCSFQSN